MAQTWALIAILAASQTATLGIFLRLSTRIDALNASLGARIDTLSESFLRHTH